MTKHFYTTILLLSGVINCVYSQEVPQDEKKRDYQVEFVGGTGGGNPRDRTYMLGAGINKQGKKENWYTNYAVSFSHYGTFSPYNSDYITLTTGKHYQWKKGNFYGSLGINGGIFATYSGRRDYSGVGLTVIPRMELGVNADKVIMAVGLFTSLGYGYFRDPSAPPNFYNSNNLGLTGSFTPYVKIILK